MATLREFITQVVQSIFEMGPKFEPVATQDPLSAISMAMGGLFVLGASGVLAYLTIGALIDLLGASSSPR
ncbi:MAG: hypothetical protein V5A56_11250 [Halolamina sp.]